MYFGLRNGTIGWSSLIVTSIIYEPASVLLIAQSVFPVTMSSANDLSRFKAKVLDNLTTTSFYPFLSPYMSLQDPYNHNRTLRYRNTHKRGFHKVKSSN